MIDWLVQATAPPLGERLLLAIVGPLVSALIGTGVIGFILLKVGHKADANRSAVEDARARHEFEGALKQEVLTIGLTDSTALYLATQHYWRVKDDPELSTNEKVEARTSLDEQYLKSRASLKVLEARLEALFETERPAVEWHKLDDLLTVRYMQLTGSDTERLYRLNEKGYEGKEHSGLTVAEMRNPVRLLSEYHAGIKAAAAVVLDTPFRKVSRG